MATHKLLLLPGDGIGPEVMREVEKIVGWFRKRGIGFETETDLVGGAAYDVHKVAITDDAMERAQEADAVLFGAVGGPKWDAVPYAVRPEAALLRLRKDLGLFANIRPAICYPALADASSLKREIVEGLDIVIVRELTGGVYFGEPKETRDPRGRLAARRRHAGLYHRRDRAHRAGRLRHGPQAPQQGVVGREEQRDEDRRALAPGRVAAAQGRLCAM